jgi:hypothetical protein
MRSMSEPVSRPPLTLVAKRTPPRTDLGNAERFVAQHGENVRFLPAWGKWLLWAGTHWRIDDTLEVKRFAKETVRSIYAEAKEQPTSEAREEMAKHAAKSEAEGKIRAMLELAKAEPGVAITTAALDADPVVDRVPERDDRPAHWRSRRAPARGHDHQARAGEV